MQESSLKVIKINDCLFIYNFLYFFNNFLFALTFLRYKLLIAHRHILPHLYRLGFFYLVIPLHSYLLFIYSFPFPLLL